MVAAARGGGKRIGYVRVSSVDQNEARQLEEMDVDKTFIDKCSGKDTNRPQLQAALEYLRDGDVLVVHSLDRLARNLDDLRKIVTDLTGRGVHVHFIRGAMTFTGEDNPMSKLMMSVMGAFAEFERAIIRERQLEGIALAKERGVYRGRKPSMTDDKVKAIRKRLKAGETIAALAREYGFSRETLYQYGLRSGGAA